MAISRGILEANKQSGKPSCLARCLNAAFVGVLRQGVQPQGPPTWSTGRADNGLYPLPLGFMFPSMKKPQLRLLISPPDALDL